MELTREFPRCIFKAAVIREALEVFLALPREEDAEPTVLQRRISVDVDTWSFDDTHEFLGAYERGFWSATLHLDGAQPDSLNVFVYSRGSAIQTTVSVKRAARSEIERVLAVFTDARDAAWVPEPETVEEPLARPRVFIGHGASPAWRDLKDHLQDQHGYDIEAYETGARAGHTIRDILDSMLERSSFAVLVLTAEDEQSDGEFRARQNVVHETGLFQGKLGFDRAIVVLEEGVEAFSNLQGIHQIRVGRGRIRESFGDVVATLRREFPEN